jgi:hypothetical protein
MHTWASPGWALVLKTTYAPMIYTAPCILLLMGAASITRASGKGLGPGNLEFFGPQMALAYWLDAISQGLKTLDFQGPTLFPLALVMDAARITSITHGAV